MECNSILKYFLKSLDPSLVCKWISKLATSNETTKDLTSIYKTYNDIFTLNCQWRINFKRQIDENFTVHR